MRVCKYSLIVALLGVLNSVSGQTLSIPAVAAGQLNNYFVAGTGDGASLMTYNSFLRLHYGLAIGSPYTSNGSGGYIEKATISFDGRSGNINTLGTLHIGPFDDNRASMYWYSNKLLFPHPEQ